MKEDEGEPTVSLRADFYKIRIEVGTDESGREVWRGVREWRSADLPDFVLFEEATAEVEA
jgi:hypothetical protein